MTAIPPTVGPVSQLDPTKIQAELTGIAAANVIYERVCLMAPAAEAVSA